MDNYLSQFSELLKHEAATIERAARRLQPLQIERAVKLLVECRSKVIVTGIGKSGFIARKVAATLTSTGPGPCSCIRPMPFTEIWELWIRQT